jgi:hypothetical protein
VRLGALFGAAGLVALVTYVPAGPHVFDQVHQASEMVSLAGPWHLFRGVGGGLLVTLPHPAVQTGALVLFLLLAVLLARGLPAADRTFRVAAVLVLAWLFSAPYVLPWYDGLAWAVLALPAVAVVEWSRFHWVLLAHTTALSLAYLPARAANIIGLPGNLLWLQDTLRAKIMPWVLLAVLGTLVLAALPRRAPVAAARRPAAAEPRP